MNAEGAIAGVGAFWVELLGALVAATVAAAAILRGDPLSLLAAVVLAVYAADRTRIRLDNRSMARALVDAREGEETD